nr:hypothetical protein [uncultured Carboxylicivirga sp.]
MKKKVFNAFGLLAIAAILTLNVNVVLDGSSSSHLQWNVMGKILATVYGSGSAQPGGWSNVWQGQGWTKDESIIQEPCPSVEYGSGSGSASGSYGGASGSASGSGSHYQENPEGRTDIRCGSGSINCTPVAC